MRKRAFKIGFLFIIIIFIYIKFLPNNQIEDESFLNYENLDNICSKELFTLIILVASAPLNLEKRILIRETWGHDKFKENVKTVFLIGSSSNKSTNRLIYNEIRLHEDIVHLNIIDSYSNLTLKTTLGLKWVSKYCTSSKFILKTDDDVVVNTRVVRSYLKKLNNGFYYMGHMPSLKVNRNKKAKFSVLKSEFKQSYFDPYFVGVGYFLSSNLANDLYESSLRTPMFKFEDVYVGMLVKNLNYKVEYVKLNDKILNLRNKSLSLERLMVNFQDYFIIYPKENDLKKIWSLF